MGAFAQPTGALGCVKRCPNGPSVFAHGECRRMPHVDTPVYLIIWLVVWNMTFISPIPLGISWCLNHQPDHP